MRPYFEKMKSFGRQLNESQLKSTEDNIGQIKEVEAQIRQAVHKVKTAGFPEEKNNARGEMTAAWTLEKEGYFDYEKEWQTANDDIVCGICEPLHGTRVRGTKANFPNGTKGPPAHPGCRCWVNMIPQVA